MLTRQSVGFLSVVVMVATFAVAGWDAAVGTESSTLPPIYTVPGELDMLVRHGHIQGATCSEKAIYLSHAQGIVKLDWKSGRVLKKCEARAHLGDIAYADGRVYGVYGLHDAKNGESPQMIGVWDEGLEPIEERHYSIPGAHGFDSAVVIGDTLYTSVGYPRGKKRWDHPPHTDNTFLMVSTKDLSVKGIKKIDYDYPIHFSTQTLGTDGVDLLCGNYGAKREEGNVKGLNFSRVTTDMKLVDSRRFLASEGFALVPKSVSGRETPVFFNVNALGGNMQGWRKDPTGNPPRIRLDFFAYDTATGEMKNITDYSGNAFVHEAEGASRRAAVFRAKCAAAGQRGAFCVGVATSMENMRPRYGALPNVEAKELNVRLARGEKESLQVFVMSKEGDLRNVRVLVGALRGECGAVLPASAVSVAALGYVNVTNAPPYSRGFNVFADGNPGYARVGLGCELGWWPDPILSHVDRVDVCGDDLQGFWIRVRAPRDQKAGIYRGRVAMVADGVKGVSIPIAVRVNAFEIPATPMLPLAVTTATRAPDGWEGRMKEESSRLRGDPKSPVNAWKKRKGEWCDFFTEHYLSWDDLYGRYGAFPDFEMLERQSARGLEGLFNLGYWMAPEKDGLEKWRGHTLGRLRRAYDEAKRRGILHRAYAYGCDEAGVGKFADVRRAAEEIRRVLPGVPLMTTAFDKEYGAGTGLAGIDWFVPQTVAYDRDGADCARTRGRRVWWYFACDQKAPCANSFVEGQAIEMRSVMGAQSVKYRPDGFLYYATGIWNAARPVGSSPFTDWNPRSWHDYHGDGSWTYCGPDGIPLSSIRLENFADGLEDYAYAMILERKLKEAENGMLKIGDEWVRRARELLAVPREVVDSVKNFSDDPAVLYRWRDAMADLIEAAMGDGFPK